MAGSPPQDGRWARLRRRLATSTFLLPGGLKAWKMIKDTPAAVADLRRSYDRGSLEESLVSPDPFTQFDIWFKDALATVTKPAEPNAMTLATVDDDGLPATRTVLLKGYDARGFVFFTNYESRKGRHLASRPFASLLFWWPPLERQIEIRGTVERVSPQETEHYFHSRPVTHQLGAWASRQSEVIASRRELEQRIESLMREHAGRDIPVPPFWGGLRVLPTSIEFWQGRPSRLHDRLRYTRSGPSWTLTRLSP